MTLNLFESNAPAALRSWRPQDWPTAADWQPIVQSFLCSGPGESLAVFMRQRLDAGAVVYPPQPFRALELTALADVRVVILGQDPYHGPGEAEGLAFSVPAGVKVPPSLRNIFKELQRDTGAPPPTSGSLVRWAQQGVLLLNTSLTVDSDTADSHAKKGWEALTDGLIDAVARKKEAVVFLLWGGHAQAKRALIDAHNAGARHLVLCANHPSPLAALRPPLPFIGCGHFSAVNQFLRQNKQAPVAWCAA